MWLPHCFDQSNLLLLLEFRFNNSLVYFEFTFLDHSRVIPLQRLLTIHTGYLRILQTIFNDTKEIHTLLLFLVELLHSLDHTELFS